MDGLVIRPYRQSDAGAIAEMINRDPYNLQKGITPAEYDRYLDEPGERIRENTFAAFVQRQLIGYISLCFCANVDHMVVYSYSGVDVAWRRRGAGRMLFQFIIDHLNQVAKKEKRRIVFVHRVDSRIPGLMELAVQHQMVKRHESLMLRAALSAPVPIVPLTGYTFRTPLTSDAEAWAAIYNDAFNVCSKTKDHIVHEFSSSDFNPDLYILASDEKGDAAAFISSIVVGETGKIPTIAVKRSRQGQGLGMALLAEALVRLYRSGAKEVTLSVAKDNDRAIQLYSKFGFAPYASRCNFIKEFSP